MKIEAIKRGAPRFYDKSLVRVVVCAAISVSLLQAGISARERQELVRGLNAEYGTAKVIIPRSKKPLDILPDGTFDPEAWGDAMMESGPAARLGDIVQITKVEFKGKRILLQINNGISGGRKWWHRVQVSGTSSGTTLGQGQNTHAPGGTLLALYFKDEKELPQKTAVELKELLDPVLDFNQRSATEIYLDTVEPVYKEAIEQKEVIEGMDREMTRLSMGMPTRRVRDFEDGNETEDWIYGKPPGEIVFVTFENGKVINVKYEHANLGGQTREREPIPEN